LTKKPAAKEAIVSNRTNITVKISRLFVDILSSIKEPGIPRHIHFKNVSWNEIARSDLATQ
jgi:hypothetical protein